MGNVPRTGNSPSACSEQIQTMAMGSEVRFYKKKMFHECVPRGSELEEFCEGRMEANTEPIYPPIFEGWSVKGKTDSVQKL